jgi:hypothetical protein
MQSRYRASLGSEIYGESDALGNLWILSEIEGWFSPGSSGQVTQRSARDGAWRSKAYRTARGLTMRGAVISVRDNVGDVLDRVLDSIPLDAPAPLTVYGVNGDDRVMYVRQEGEPDIRILSEYEATFSIGLVSPDGMKYGANEKVASTNLPTSLGGLRGTAHRRHDARGRRIHGSRLRRPHRLPQRQRVPPRLHLRHVVLPAPRRDSGRLQLTHLLRLRERPDRMARHVEVRTLE